MRPTGPRKGLPRLRHAYRGRHFGALASKFRVLPNAFPWRGIQKRGSADRYQSHNDAQGARQHPFHVCEGYRTDGPPYEFSTVPARLKSTAKPLRKRVPLAFRTNVVLGRFWVLTYPHFKGHASVTRAIFYHFRPISPLEHTPVHPCVPFSPTLPPERRLQDRTPPWYVSRACKGRAQSWYPFLDESKPQVRGI